MARASKRAGFGKQRGSVSPRITYSEIAPNLPQNGDEWIKKSTSQKYVYDKATTTWIPLFGSGGQGSVFDLVYHNDTNTTAVSTNVEVGTVDITMTNDGAIIVYGTFVGTASTAMTLTTLIKLDTVTQHTIVDYVSGAVDHTVNFSVVLENISSGSYTVSVDMSASTGTFTLDASEQHLFTMNYYDVIIPEPPSTITSKSYIVGGFSTAYIQDTDEYTALTDSWANKTDMPTPARGQLGLVSISSSVYAFAGFIGSSTYIQDTDEYTPDTWSNKTDCPSPARRDHGSCTISSKGYIFVGFNGSANLQDTDEYTPDTWASKTNAPTPARRSLGCSTIDSKGYIYTGFSTADLRDTDEYTPDTWASKTDCPSPARYQIYAFTLNDSKGYITGGYSGTVTLSDCDEYDPVGNTWASKTSLPSPARRLHSSSEIGGGDGYVYSGRDTSGNIADVDSFDGSSWTAKANITSPSRRVHASSSL